MSASSFLRTAFQLPETLRNAPPDTLLLVVSGLAMLAIALFTGAKLLGSLRWRRERRYDDAGLGDLIDDLAELDDLHDQGILSHDELVAAKRRRWQLDESGS